MAEEGLQESKLSQEELDKIISGMEGESQSSPLTQPKEENLSDLLQNLGESSSENLLSEDLASALTNNLIGQDNVSLTTSTQIEKSNIQVQELYDVTVRFAVELGRTMMSIKDIILLGEGSIVELDKHVGDEVDILINDRLFGRGKLVLLDEFYGVQITQILNPSTFKNL